MKTVNLKIKQKSIWKDVEAEQRACKIEQTGVADRRGEELAWLSSNQMRGSWSAMLGLGHG